MGSRSCFELSDIRQKSTGGARPLTFGPEYGHEREQPGPSRGENASEAGPNLHEERGPVAAWMLDEPRSSGKRDSSVEGAPISELRKWRWRALWRKRSRRHRILTMKGCDRERPWTRSPASARVEHTRVKARLDTLEALR